MAKRKRIIEIDENEIVDNVEKKVKRKKIMPPNLAQDITFSEKQKELIELIENNKIITIIGPAGTSKTFISCYCALNALNKGSIDKIILTKPIKEAGESLGYLPGDVKDKIDPYYESYASNIVKFIKPDNYKKLVEDSFIETKPLAYMRGTNLDNCIMILDEGQNCTMKQLMLFLTRMGKNSKVIIAGDIRQHDIRREDVALPFMIGNILDDIDEVANFEFTDDDIVRNKILIEITKKYEKLKDDAKLPKHF